MAVAGEEQIQIVTATLSTRSEFEFQNLGLSAQEQPIAFQLRFNIGISGGCLVSPIPYG